MHNVLVYRSEVLPVSETFIAGQVAALTRFKASVIGLWPAKQSLRLPVNTLLLCTKRTTLSIARKTLFVMFGVGPGFYATVRKIKASLMHVHFATDASSALLLANKLGLPLVVTLHGSDVTRTDRALGAHVEGRVYVRRRPELWKRTAVFLCSSRFIRDQALDRGFPADKLRVHYIGIDCDRFRPSSINREPKLVLFVGRLVAVKGCKYLLDAMHMVQQTHPDARTVVIGDGPERQQLMAQAETLGIACQFLGAQSSHQVNQWLQKARVFCAPSVTAPDGQKEALGIVFAEAQATGLPVVSFAHGGIPEIVKANVTGLLAPERDPVMLARHIIRLIEDDALWSRFSQEAVSWIRQQFDIRQQTAILENIYSEVISVHPECQRV